MGTPVFIVPGFMSWEFQVQRTWLPDLKVWINKQVLATHLLDWLQLADDGLSPGRLAPGPVFTQAYAEPSYYLPLAANLLGNGYDVFHLLYDWRKTMQLAVVDLAQLMRQANAAGPWACVCHSMGAMIALLAWRTIQPLGEGTNCKRFVWVNPLVGGCWTAAQALAGGLFDSLGWGVATSFMSLLADRLTAPWTAVQSQGTRLRRAVATWPALYECLPSTFGPFATLSSKAADLYHAENWIPSNPAISPTWLDNAQAIQQRVAAALAAPLPPGVMVRSSPADTPIAMFTETTNYADPEGYETSGEGDGVIPWNRGTIPGANVLTIASSHAAAASETQFLALLRGIIEQGFPVSEQLDPLPVPQLPPSQPVTIKTLTPPAFPALQIAQDP